MAGSEFIVEVVGGEANLDYQGEDIDMIDACSQETGEVEISGIGDLEKTIVGETTGGIKSQNRKVKKKRKKKNKKKSRKSESLPHSIGDMHRFVIETSKHLKEKKQYLVWNAIGCLGVSTFKKLVREVDAIEACGGQLTGDGVRFRTGGGILWNILKTREPRAYKEIMAKSKEIEKQLHGGNKKHNSKISRDGTFSESFQAVGGTDDEIFGSQAQCSNGGCGMRKLVTYGDLFEEPHAVMPNT